MKDKICPACGKKGMVEPDGIYCTNEYCDVQSYKLDVRITDMEKAMESVKSHLEDALYENRLSYKESIKILKQIIEDLENQEYPTYDLRSESED